MTAPEGWATLLEHLEPYVSPEWSKNAQEHGDQPWIRLILLVDAHHQLSTPRVAEKVAMTMADLAVDRESERKGWEAIRESGQTERMNLVAGLALCGYLWWRRRRQSQRLANYEAVLSPAG